MENIRSNRIDVVIVPPMAGDRDVPSDEEQEDDNDLDQDYMPHDIAGEIEVQHDCEDSTEKVEQSDSKRWRKKSKFLVGST